MELHLLLVNWQRNLLGAPVPGHHVGIEDFLGNRATSGQGGIVALAHGANEILQREQGEPWNRGKWIAGQSKPATNLISRSSGKGGAAKQWGQQDFDITSLLDHNKQTERHYFTAVSMVDAKPQREHYEDRDPKGQEFDGILSEEEEFTVGADASSSNTVKKKRGFPEIARERGARAKSKPGGKGCGGKGLRGRKNNVMETAMACARDKGRLEQEAEELEAKYFSETSKQGKESRASTVLQLAKEVTGGHPFPLSKLTVVRVSACLRATKIQSGDQYLGELRAMHVESGHSMGELLDRTFKLCQRALRRDRGPECRAPEYRLNLITEETLWQNLHGQKAVMWPILAYHWAVVWMLREIELREVRIKDVTLGRQQKRVTLMIRKSKMDQAAKGVRRTLACICQSGNCTMACPWALALVVLGRRDSARREDHLFATVMGSKATKDAMTKAWQTLLCEEIKGHSPRRTGAMHYVRMGMAIQDLAYLGRWKSQAVLRYAEEALEDQPVNETFIQREEMKSMIQRNRKGTSRVIKEDEEGDHEEKEHLKTKESKKGPEGNPDVPETPPTEEPGEVAGTNPLVKKQSIVLFVKSTGRNGNRPLHKVAIANWKQPTSSWSTACGWKFAAKSSRFAFVTGEEKGRSFCSKCKEAGEKRDDVKEVEMWRTELPTTGS